MIPDKKGKFIHIAPALLITTNNHMPLFETTGIPHNVALCRSTLVFDSSTLRDQSINIRDLIKSILLFQE